MVGRRLRTPALPTPHLYTENGSQDDDKTHSSPVTTSVVDSATD